jgi:chemotaxis protein MotA
MDIATVVGISAGMVLLTFGTIYAGLGAGDVLNIPSVLITFGGATAATMISATWDSTLSIGKVTRKAFFVDKFDIPGLITTLVSFSEKARREGLLALEDDVNELPVTSMGLCKIIQRSNWFKLNNKNNDF